ncbi:META domain-containing protein [Erwinia psidii]|uniref:META domain-containing protein n=1 Tax=Erwinia psidii TaxID=69224 RepID=UPI00226B1DE2|nr:META domain-containing protein [Erwinia psidii]MCX8966419.1 META domain-containing protein [Erwinia psidii]
MKKKGMVILAAILLSGCGALSGNAGNNPLTDHNYILKSVDGKVVTSPAGMKPGISFSQDMHVSGVMCNRFFGQGKLEHGVLSVPQMASTRMLCIDPELNQWEAIIGKMLVAGATLHQDRKTLTLEGSGHSLVYVRDN